MRWAFAIISRNQSFTRDFEASLWGSVLAVDTGEIIAIGVVSGIVVAVFFLAYKLFLFATFDPEVAQFYGVLPDGLTLCSRCCWREQSSFPCRFWGVTMIAAAIVIPPIVARLLTNSFRKMALASTGIGVFCGAAGFYISYFIDVSSGASVVLLSAALFVLAMAWAKIRIHINRTPTREGSLSRLPQGSGSALE